MLSKQEEQEIYEVIRAYAKDRFLKEYRTDVNTNNFDDVLQEAWIRAWKDIQDGSKDWTHIINRALMFGKEKICNPKCIPTGGFRRSREGITRKSGDLHREKIENYRSEFRNLHGTLPSIRTIAEAVGLSDHTVRHHIYSPASYISPMVKDKSGSSNYLDRSAYHMESINRFDSADDLDESYRDWLGEPSFEENLIADYQFSSILNLIEDPITRKIFYRLFVDMKTQREIAKELGHTQRYVNARYRKALDFLRNKLEENDYFN